jgi:hypothetical protein
MENSADTRKKTDTVAPTSAAEKDRSLRISAASAPTRKTGSTAMIVAPRERATTCRGDGGTRLMRITAASGGSWRTSPRGVACRLTSYWDTGTIRLVRAEIRCSN